MIHLRQTVKEFLVLLFKLIILFNTIHFFAQSQMVPCIARYYKKIQLKISDLFTHILNVKQFLFLKVQFNISHLFVYGLNVKQLNLTHRYDFIRYCHSGVRVGLRTVVMKRYSTSSKGPGLDPNHQIF